MLSSVRKHAEQVLKQALPRAHKHAQTVPSSVQIQGAQTPCPQVLCNQVFKKTYEELIANARKIFG